MVESATQSQKAVTRFKNDVLTKHLIVMVEYRAALKAQNERRVMAHAVAIACGYSAFGY